MIDEKQSKKKNTAIPYSLFGRNTSLEKVTASVFKKLLLFLTLLIFITELFIMFSLPLLPAIPVWTEALLDAFTLIILLLPGIYFLFFRPLKKSIARHLLAEETMRVNEEYFRTLTENTHDGIVIVGGNYRIEYANPELGRIVQVAPDELIGQDFRQFLTEDSKAMISGYYQRRMKGEDAPTRYEFSLTRKDGEIRVMEMISAVIRDVDQDIRTIGQVRDITEQRKAENKLKKQGELLRATLEATDDGLLVVDDQRGVVLTNNRFAEMWHIPSELIQAKDDNKLIDHVLDQLQDPQAFVKKVRELYQSGRKSIDTLYFKDGRIFERYSSPLLQEGEVGGRVWSFRDVTQRKKLENELQEREAFLSTIVENIPISLFIKDAGNLQFLRCNRAREELFGYSREELIGKTNEDLFPEKLAEFLTEKDREAVISGGLVEVAEERVSTRNKGERILHTKKIPLFDEQGKPRYLLGISEDITEQKEMEKALRESEERFQQIVDVIPDVLYVVDEKTREFSYLSPAFTKMFGYTEADIQKMGGREAFLNQVIQYDQFKNQKEKYELLKSEETVEPVRWESWWRCKNGRLLCIEDISVPRYLNARLLGTYGTLRNITERKAAEQEIRKLSQAVEQSPVSIVVTDLDGNIEYVNPKFCRLTGYSFEESLGQNPRILKSGEQPKEFYENLWQTITKGETWYGEFHNMKKNGDLFWEKAIIGPIKADDGTISHFMAIKEDITERKQLEDQFRQAQKMEAVGTLAGGVAHDFNNLLTVINGYTQLILQDLDKKDPLYEDIREIYEAGERAAQLTQQLLAFSRKQLVVPEVLDLNDILHLLEKMLRRLLGEDILLTIDYDEQPCIIDADRTQIDQVIMNLAVNARDAMPEGGQLNILTKNIVLTGGEHEQSVLSLVAGEYILLTVSDTGEGMDELTRDKIFEPFFTTKKSGKGTGLGLAMVYGIVKQSGGAIQVDSEPGKGTTFKIFFPGSASDRQEVSAQNEDAKLHGSETILVVEDEDMVRQLAYRTLNRAGYRVLAAQNGGEAFMICEKMTEPLHLLVTDVVMPVINGRELAERLLEMKPGMKVLYMSGYTDDAIIRNGLIEKELDLLQKPFAPPDLLRKVRTVLDGEKVLS